MDLHPKQFVRVHVRTLKSEGVETIVDRHFGVDPRTVTLDRLRHLVARALDVRGEFSMSCLRTTGESVPLSCDWDLEGALSEESSIQLTLERQPKEPGFEEWDIICPADVPVAGHEASCAPQTRKESFLEQVLHLCTPHPASSVLTASEFASLADWPCPLRYAVYRAGGAEPGARPALWMHLLDVYPTGAEKKEREDFLNRKAEEYYGLRHGWQKLVHAGTVPAVLRDVTCLVRKDVRRTDRLLELDERALYNVLTTYAVHHPSVGYCQGMSDLLSPLLHVMGTEARAYVAFCGLMQRMRDNFRRDGRSVRTKFRHLRRALRTHDPPLHDHLARCGALDLLFCYRWLLLDLKREFPYGEMLRLAEVLWSTLRPAHREKGVELYEVRFPTPDVRESLGGQFEEDDENDDSPRRTLEKCPQKNDIADEWHLRDPQRSGEYDSRSTLRGTTADECPSEEDPGGAIPTPTSTFLKRRASLSRRQNVESEDGSSTEEDDEGGREDAIRPHRRRCRLRSRSRSLHETRVDEWLQQSSERRRHGSSDSNYGSNFSEEEEEEEDPPPSCGRSRSEGYDSEHRTLTDRSSCSSTEDDDDDSFAKSAGSTDTFRSRFRPLPGPTRFGDGKPFLIFLCLTMLTRHREAILQGGMDASEIGIHFDRLVRAHRLDDVLPEAKRLFEEYLRTGWTEDE